MDKKDEPAIPVSRNQKKESLNRKWTIAEETLREFLLNYVIFKVISSLQLAQIVFPPE